MGQSASLTLEDRRGHRSLYLLYKQRGCKEYAFTEEIAISAPLLPKTGRIAFLPRLSKPGLGAFG
jgi:hypothetical protein